jgi:Putative zinc-finger
MSCEGYDWKGYALGELAAGERREAEAHAATCEGCRGELAPRWWEMFMRPTFAAACVLAAAIVMHGYVTRPPAVDAAAIQAQVNQAVGRAVADVQQRNADLERQVTVLYATNTGTTRQ